MAVPFRRKSSTRIRKGRGPSTWKFTKQFSNQPLVECSTCQQKKMLHHICSHCLTYKKLDFKKVSLNKEKKEEKSH